MSRLVRLAAVLALCVVLGPTLSGHHSQSEYDLRAKVAVEGTITKIEWKSPHAWIYVDATNASGQKVNWSFELPSPVTLMRRGWTRDSLKPGDRVSIVGAPARNYPDIAIANSIKDASGKPLFTGTTQVYDPDNGDSTGGR